MKTNFISEGQFPKHDQYVLARVLKDNWGDTCPLENFYWKVVKFQKGISEKERSELPSDSQRKKKYKGCDVSGNNLVPWNWSEFGLGKYFGQEVDAWVSLDEIQHVKEH